MIRASLLVIATMLPTPALADPPPASPPPSATAPDGKVTGLNEATYRTVKTIKARNPGAFTERDANELAAAIRQDSMIDAVELDLLKELTNSQFRSITITPAGAAANSTSKTVTYPVSGNARTVLLHVINPPVDLAAEWAKPDHGWKRLVAEYKMNSVQEAKVLEFVTAELRKKWDLSTMENGYKPIRDQIGKLYGYSNSLEGDSSGGRSLLYKAMLAVDRQVDDNIPDFLYNWTRPGGYPL